MKKSNILLMAVVAILMVTAVSCTTMRSNSEYEDVNRTERRIMANDPYFYNNVPLLVRDPYTGRLYEVMPYGYSPYRSYGSSFYNDRYYDRNYYQRRGNTNTRVSEEQQRQKQENINKSREKILGRGN